MLTTSSGVNRTTAANLYYQPTERAARVSEAPTSHNYDSVTISSAPTGESRFQRDLVSRLSNEIRTATTTGDIQSLRRQVASGTYEVDASAIAARILFLGED